MKIEAHWQGGMHFRCSSPSQHTIDIDSGLKGATRGPAPMEVLLLAVACCSGMDVVSILQKKKKEPVTFSITAEGEQAETHPKKFTKVRLHFKLKKDGLSEEEFKHVISLSIDKYCPVIGTITPTAEVTWDCELIRC